MSRAEKKMSVRRPARPHPLTRPGVESDLWEKSGPPAAKVGFFPMMELHRGLVGRALTDLRDETWGFEFGAREGHHKRTAQALLVYAVRQGKTPAAGAAGVFR